MFLFYLKRKGIFIFFFFFSSRRRHTRLTCDWSSDVCSSDLAQFRRRWRAGRDSRADSRGIRPLGSALVRGAFRGRGLSMVSRHTPAKAPGPLARIPHQVSATARDKAVSTSLRLVTVLDILSKYADTR